jgi:hypothetical protein
VARGPGRRDGERDRTRLPRSAGPAGRSRHSRREASPARASGSWWPPGARIRASSGAPGRLRCTRLCALLRLSPRPSTCAPRHRGCGREEKACSTWPAGGTHSRPGPRVDRPRWLPGVSGNRRRALRRAHRRVDFRLRISQATRALRGLPADDRGRRPRAPARGRSGGRRWSSWRPAGTDDPLRLPGRGVNRHSPTAAGAKLIHASAGNGVSWSLASADHGCAGTITASLRRSIFAPGPSPGVDSNRAGRTTKRGRWNGGCACRARPRGRGRSARGCWPRSLPERPGASRGQDPAARRPGRTGCVRRPRSQHLIRHADEISGAGEWVEVGVVAVCSPSPSSPTTALELAAHLGGGRDRRRHGDTSAPVTRRVRARLRDLDAAAAACATGGADRGRGGHGNGAVVGLRRDRGDPGPPEPAARRRHHTSASGGRREAVRLRPVHAPAGGFR